MRCTALLVVLLAARVAGAQAPSCVIRGTPERLQGLRVSPGEARSFSVTVEGLAVAAHLATSPGHGHVAVEGPLAFDAEAREVPVAVAAPVVIAHGLVNLSPTSEVRAPRASGGIVVASLRLAAASTTGAVVANLPVPCDALRVGEPSPGDSRPTGRGDWQPAHRTVVLRAAPGAGMTVRLTVEDPTSFRFEQTAARGMWRQVASRWSDGSAVQGWVPRGSLRRPPQFSGYGTRVQLRAMDLGQCGAVPESGYRGPATITPGTPVLAAPDGRRWATVRASAGITVRLEAGSPWATLVRVQGLTEDGECGDLVHAWVPASAVTIPDPLSRSRSSRASPFAAARSPRPADP